MLNLLLLSRQGHASLPGADWARLQQVATVRVERRVSAPGLRECAELLADIDLIGATNACLPPVTAELLDAAPRLRGIVLYATGYDHLDVRMLAERGVGLSVVNDYATTAVAEHTMELIFALATRLHVGNDRCRGLVPGDVSLRGVELAGRVLGVVGLGRIGLRVARMAEAFGLQVAACDIDAAAVTRARLSGITTRPLDELLGVATIVSVCASHHLGAKPIIGGRELAAMAPETLLVNASRAALVDTPAVVAALRLRRLRGYGVDDHVDKDGDYGDVAAEGRLLQTGHSAWWRDEVLRRGAHMWAERLIAAAEGAPLDVVTWPAAGADLDAELAVR